MQWRAADSLARQVLSRMIWGATLVVMLITGVGYWHVYNQAEQNAIGDLKRFVQDHAEQESLIFQLAEDELNTFKLEYLSAYQRNSAAGDLQFEALFFRDDQGAMRLKREYFDGVSAPGGLLRSGMSGFVGNNVKRVDDDLKRRLVIGYQLTAEMAPRCATRFAKFYLHATFPENAIVVYWPEEPWGLQAKADLIMTDFAVVKSSLQQYNPQRQAVWSDLYYDLTANQWSLTYQMPVDYQGRHLVTPSIDIKMNELVERMVAQHLDGAYNVVISASGKLIAHPDKLEELKRPQGELPLDQLKDPTLSNIYRQIRERGEVTSAVQVIDDENGNDLAVAKLNGPDWWFITVYPKTLIRAEAHQAAQIILVLGASFLLLTMLLVRYVLQRNVAAPMKLLETAATTIAGGRYDEVIDGGWKERAANVRETKLLVDAFCRMAERIRDSNKILEDTIEERTKELAAANAQLTEWSFRDGLTGVKNRRAFDQDLQLRFTEARESGVSFALLVCDIDFFKRYNDQYGHEYGDRALRIVADAIVGCVGERAEVYRYGGEEFTVILTGAPQEWQSIAERMLDGVRSRRLEHGGSPQGIVTLSAGLAAYRDAMKDGGELFAAADKNLYQAKEAGRDRVVG